MVSARICLADYLEVEDFKSDCLINQQLLSIRTAPDALAQQYSSSDPKPDLHQFTPLFDDGRNAMYMYSNPNFFFTAWRKTMESEALKKRNSEIKVNSREPLSHKKKQ